MCSYNMYVTAVYCILVLIALFCMRLLTSSMVTANNDSAVSLRLGTSSKALQHY